MFRDEIVTVADVQRGAQQSIGCSVAAGQSTLAQVAECASICEMLVCRRTASDVQSSAIRRKGVPALNKSKGSGREEKTIE
jgi:hypothetical protein